MNSVEQTGWIVIYGATIAVALWVIVLFISFLSDRIDTAARKRALAQQRKQSMIDGWQTCTPPPGTEIIAIMKWGDVKFIRTRLDIKGKVLDEDIVGVDRNHKRNFSIPQFIFKS